MTTYSVKEVYFTRQGEGLQAGRNAVFLRFAGCNLWTGLEVDRSHAVCKFCDTDFVGVDGEGGGKFRSADALADRVADTWLGEQHRLVVCTGGEPLLQLDKSLIEALHARGFEIAVETNGTIAAPDGIDWICVSPKAGSELVQRTGAELKLVYPQAGIDPEDFEDFDFGRFCLQPMDGPELSRHTAAASAYCRAHRRWRLSLQMHKLVGIR